MGLRLYSIRDLERGFEDVIVNHIVFARNSTFLIVSQVLYWLLWLVFNEIPMSYSGKKKIYQRYQFLLKFS